MISQMSLFDQPADDRELPLIIAESYGFPLQYHEIDGKNLYAVQDWLRGVAQGQGVPDQFLKDFRRLHPETVEKFHPLKYTARDGKKYTRDFADAETLYKVTQSFRGASDLHNKVLDYLAKAGVLVDEMRRDPGKAIDAGIVAYIKQGMTRDEAIKAASQRGQMKAERNETTQLLSGLPGVNYGKFTNIEYVGMFKRTAQEMKDQLKSKDVRTAMSKSAAAYVLIAEETFNELFKRLDRATFDEACNIMRQIATVLGVQIDALNDLLGIDLVTGRPLLK